MMKIDFARIYSGVIGACAYAKSLFTSGEARVKLREDFRKWCDYNGVLFLIALALASIIYFSIHDTSIETFERRVNIQGTDAPPNVTLGFDPPVVTVKFRGTREDRLALDLNPPSIHIPYPKSKKWLDQLENAAKDITIDKRRHVKIPSRRGVGSVTIVGVEPSVVSLVSDKEVSRVIPVLPPKLIGSPNKGHAEVDYNPKQVTVVGGSRKLKGWEFVGKKLRLPDVSVEDRVRSFSEEAKVLPPDGEDFQGVTFAPDKVNVSVSVVLDRREQTFSNLPVLLSMPVGVSLPEGTEIEPDMVSVTLTGSDDDLSKVDAEKIIVHALIDSVSSVVTNETELPLSVHVPSSALLFDVAPSPQCVRLIPGRNQRETAMESAPVKVNTVTGALYDEESENPGGDDGATLLPPQTNDLNTAAAMLGFCDNSAASTNAPVLSLPASLELPGEDGEATTNQFLIKEQQMKEDK